MLGRPVNAARQLAQIEKMEHVMAAFKRKLAKWKCNPRGLVEVSAQLRVERIFGDGTTFWGVSSNRVRLVNEMVEQTVVPGFEIQHRQNRRLHRLNATAIF